MTRLLYLLRLVPNPPHGGEQRVHHLIRALAEATALSVAALPRPSDDTGAWPLAAGFAAPPRFFPRGGAEDGPPVGGLFPAPLAAWPRAVRTDYSAGLGAYVAGLDLAGHDAVLAGSLSMLPYAAGLKAKWPHLRLVLDFDYVDPLYAWRTLRAAKTRWLSRAGYWGVRNVARLLRFSRRWLPACDSVWVCSARDRDWVRRWVTAGPVAVVPNGIDCAGFAGVHPRPAGPRLLMTGSLMDGPNADGAVWFADRVWPRVRAAVPAADLWLVGRDPAPAVRRLGKGTPGVTVTGAVPDVRPHLAAAAVSVAPIRYGTGTRLKILEAMAAGLPVVSTRLGAEGLDFVPDRDLVLADRPAAFAAACVRLLTDGAARARVAAAGRAAVRRYDWAAIDRVVRAEVSPAAGPPRALDTKAATG